MLNLNLKSWIGSDKHVHSQIKCLMTHWAVSSRDGGTGDAWGIGVLAPNFGRSVHPIATRGGNYTTTLLLAPFSQHFGPSAVPAYVLATQLLEMFTLEIQVKQMFLDSIRCDLGRLNDVSWLYLQKITISSKKILPSSNNVRIKSLGRVKKKLSLRKNQRS